MKIYSEITNKEYETVEACLKAEKEATAKIEAEKAKKEKLATERKERAKAVEEAFKTANKLLNDFIKDYGSFHMSIGSSIDEFDKAFTNLLSRRFF